MFWAIASVLRTPLHDASGDGNLETSQTLLNRSAGPNVLGEIYRWAPL